MKEKKLIIRKVGKKSYRNKRKIADDIRRAARGLRETVRKKKRVLFTLNGSFTFFYFWLRHVRLSDPQNHRQSIGGKGSGARSFPIRKQINCVENI